MSRKCSQRQRFGKWQLALGLLMAGVGIIGCDQSITHKPVERPAESDHAAMKSPISENSATSLDLAGTDALNVPEADLPAIDLSPQPHQQTPDPEPEMPKPDSDSFAGLSQQEAGRLFQELTQAPDFSQVAVVAVPNASGGQQAHNDEPDQPAP